MTTLAEWLLEQIDKDIADIEGDATGDPSMPFGVHWSEVKHASCSPGVVLVDLKAKRQLVQKAARWERDNQGSLPHQITLRFVAEDVLTLLAQAYADQPGWRDEWRVE